MNDEVEYKINIEPISIILDLDKYPFGNGFKDLRITINGDEFIFTKEQIHKFILYMKYTRIINND
jgi:hypothetical protein